MSDDTAMTDISSVLEALADILTGFEVRISDLEAAALHLLAEDGDRDNA